MAGGAWGAAGAALAVFSVLVVASVAGVAPTNLLGLVQQPLPTPIQHVFLIMMENQQTPNIVPSEPYETKLANEYAWGGDSYYAICHPSTGNYMAISSGQPLHCGSDGYATYPANNLFALLQTKNVPWVAYAESMSTPCQTSNSGNYVVRHNPPPYFTDIASACAAKDLPIANLVNDYPFAAVPPAFTYIAPNLIDDGHSSSAAVGDAWLSSFVPKLMAQSWFASSVIFITYDESGNPQLNTGPGGGPVPFIAVSPYTAGVGALSSTNSHYNALATFEWLLGLPCTGSGNDCGAAPMKALFSFGGSGNPLTISSFTAVPSSVAVGGTVAFAVAANGGVVPYAYAFSGLPPGCASADLARLLCAPSEAGTFGITATVFDSAGASAHASVTLAVTNPDPSAPTLSAILVDPANPVANASYSLSASASGGTPPYSFSWGALPTGCRPNAPTATGAAAMCTTPNPGTYSATLTVTDSAAKTATSTVSVNVSAVAPPPPCCTSGTTTTPAMWFESPSHLAMLGSAALAGVGAALLVLRRVEVGVVLLIVGTGAYVFL